MARKAFLVTAGLLAIVISVGSGWAIAIINRVESEFDKYSHVPSGKKCSHDDPSCLGHVKPICIRKACNFLVLGSDTRAGLSKRQHVALGSAAGQRADTIIVVQVDTPNHRTVVLSIPRDLRVEIPGHGTGKINTAFGYGADVMVQAVENLTGLRINHFVEVNFVGFEKAIDALGGVPICTDRPLVDVLAGLRLRRPGCHNLHGAQALAFVRARHIQGDVIPDFSRISRQQQFIRALIQKSLSVGAVFHISDFIEAAKKNLIVDDRLKLSGLQELTIRLSKLGQKDAYFRVVPARPVQIEGVDYVELVQPQASELFARIRQGRGLGSIGTVALGTPISPANISVRVYDAGSGGQAQKVYEYLLRAGFSALPPVPAPSGVTRSALLWGHGAAKQEAVAASYLTTLPALYDNQHTNRSQMTVVIGPDFKGLGT
jgi:LCP family protein required for cell wall assembly